MTKIGIDLGTTFSLAAFLNDRHVPELIPDARYHDEYVTPSVIHAEGNHVLVGHTAERVLHARPTLPVTRHAKLLMGSDQVLFEDRKGTAWLPQTASAAILKKLRHDAGVRLGEEPAEATIAVPANFTSRQRLATRIAGLQAGFATIELIDEPVAAAAAYGMQHPGSDQTVFVYDLGGGTFDATVIHNAADGIHVLATAGSKQIGGKFFDEAIAADLEAHYRRISGRERLSPATREAFRQYAIDAKCTLNMQDNYRLHRDLLLDKEVHGISYSYHHLSRVLYPMLQKTIELSEQCIREAGLSWKDIDVVLMTGGSSQLPAVREKLTQASGHTDDRLVMFQPEEAIAFGAAIVGNARAHGLAGQELKAQISTYDLGILTINPETKTPNIEVIIPRNTPLPRAEVRRFFKNSPTQTSMRIRLVQQKGQRDEPESLLAFDLDVDPGAGIDTPLEIRIVQRTDGTVSIIHQSSETHVEHNHSEDRPGQPASVTAASGPVECAVL